MYLSSPDIYKHLERIIVKVIKFEIKFYFCPHICIFVSRKGIIYHVKEKSSQSSLLRRHKFSFISTGARQCHREDSYIDPQGKRRGNVRQLIWKIIRVTKQVARRQGHQLVLEREQRAGASGLCQRFDLLHPQGPLRQVVHHRRTVSSRLRHSFHFVSFLRYTELTAHIRCTAIIYFLFFFAE